MNTKIKAITYEKYLQLEGLLALGKHHREWLDSIDKAACRITGEEEGGHTRDAFYENYDAKTLLEKLQITIAPKSLTGEKALKAWIKLQE